MRFWAYRRGAAVIGMSILYAPRHAGVMLLEYLAIPASAQGGGIGSALFAASVEASRIDPGTLLLIEVDSDATEADEAERIVRRKRKHFYRRLWCREAQGLDYILPLENYGPAPVINLLVLGAGPDGVETACLKRAVSNIYENAYACAPDDPRIAAMYAGQGEMLSLT